MNNQASKAMENGLTPQLTNKSYAHATPVLPDPLERGQIDLDQHRNNHQPNKYSHRQVDVGYLDTAYKLECIREQLPQRDARDNAPCYPQAEIAFKLLISVFLVLLSLMDLFPALFRQASN